MAGNRLFEETVNRVEAMRKTKDLKSATDLVDFGGVDE
jgi:hypothetical protein